MRDANTAIAEPLPACSEQVSQGPITVNPALDCDIRARVHELLMLMNPPGQGPERRSERRYPYPALVRMTPVGRDGQTPVGPTIVVAGKTLSEGGFGFYHAGPLAARKMIASFHAGDDRWVGLLIDVRWCRFAHGWYESGGRFMQAVPAVCKAAESSSPGTI